MYRIPVLTMAKDNRVSAFFIQHPHPRGLSCLGIEMRDHAVQGHNLVCRSAVSNKEGRDYVSERGPRSKPPMMPPAKTQIFIKQVRRVHLSPWFHKIVRLYRGRRPRASSPEPHCSHVRNRRPRSQPRKSSLRVDWRQDCRCVPRGWGVHLVIGIREQCRLRLRAFLSHWVARCCH